jgi:polygalacturonase
MAASKAWMLVAGMLVLLAGGAVAGTAVNTCTVTNCDSAGSNSSAVQTVCLQTALDSCHAAAAGGLAVLILPRGVYHTGSLMLPSRTTLRFAAGATLLGSMDAADYPLVEPLPGYGLPRDCCKCVKHMQDPESSSTPPA